jgi:hypothetical protein
MKPLPMPRRLLNAFVPPPGGASHAVEPVLVLDSLPPLAPDVPAPMPRRAIEQALEEGSLRVYQPRGETEVIEAKRQ